MNKKIKQNIELVIPEKYLTMLKKIRRCLFPDECDKFIKKIKGRPFDEFLIDNIREFVKMKNDIYNMDEQTSRQLSDAWDGLLELPCNIRFIEHAIPVVLSSNENFAPYLAVMLQSLIDYTNKNRKYHFIIFERDFSESTKKCLIEQVSGFTNCELDFINVSQIIDRLQIGSPVTHVSVDGFSRLLIPYLLSGYSKVIYLDSDMISKADIADLFDIDITGHCIAAVLWASLDINLWDDSNYRFFLNNAFILHGKNIINYYNSGVMVFDTKNCREHISCQDLLRFTIYYTNRYKKRLNDQDVINIVFGNNCYTLREEWNYRWGNRDKNGIRFNQSDIDTKIIHFTTNIKPWMNIRKIAKNTDVIAYREYTKNILLYNLRKEQKQG